VIGLDLAFGIAIDKFEPLYDEMLAGAVSTSPVPVICGYASDINSNPAAQQIPINMIAGALGLAAFANVTVDTDDFVRNQELFEAASSKADDAPLAHSLALRVVEKYLGTEMELKNGQALLQGQPISMFAPRTIAINYAGPNTFPSVSLADFEAAARAGNRDQEAMPAGVREELGRVSGALVHRILAAHFYVAPERDGRQSRSTSQMGERQDCADRQ